MYYDQISIIEGALPNGFNYEGDEQHGGVSFYIGAGYGNPNTQLAIQTGSYFTKKEVMELAMILLRCSRQMIDFTY